MIRGIPAAVYPEYRDRILPFLENFAKRDPCGTTVEELEAGIRSMDMQVWSINDFQAVCMTSVTNEAVRIDRCAGIRRHEWQAELDDELREWARAIGKKRIVAVVRPGWSKWGRTRGYREAHREMVIEV